MIRESPLAWRLAGHSSVNLFSLDGEVEKVSRLLHPTALTYTTTNEITHA